MGEGSCSNPGFLPHRIVRLTSCATAGRVRPHVAEPNREAPQQTYIAPHNVPGSASLVLRETDNKLKGHRR